MDLYDAYLTLYARGTGSYDGSDIYTPDAAADRAIDWQGYVDAQDDEKAVDPERAGVVGIIGEQQAMLVIFFQVGKTPSSMYEGQDGKVVLRDGTEISGQVLKHVHLDEKIIFSYGRQSN